jgi:exonuclease III
MSLEETSRSTHYRKSGKDPHQYRIGTWNVRTLNQGGKLENLKKEMEKNGVSVMGVSEVRWKGLGEIVGSAVKEIVCNDRLIAVKLNAEPVNVLIVQVYMPTSDYEDEEVEELYDRIKDILEEDAKGDTNTIIMGDWNSVVGNKSNGNICCPYGLGNRNKRGQMFIDFCERAGLVITNTWFKNPKRTLYNWKAPGDRHRYQLDYILVKQRFRNSVKDVQIQPGADIDSDHSLLVAKICTRLKRIIRL